MTKHVEIMAEICGIDHTPITAQMFGNAAKEHMERYGTKPEHLAKIAYKNHKHSVNNPYVITLIIYNYLSYLQQFILQILTVPH